MEITTIKDIRFHSKRYFPSIASTQNFSVQYKSIIRSIVGTKIPFDDTQPNELIPMFN